MQPPDSCKTRVVLGCMDPYACNYNPNANSNVQSLCCYPGMCQDRDISLVCPTLGEGINLKISLYPNPANSQITMQSTLPDNKQTKYKVYNCFGRIEIEKNVQVSSGLFTEDVDISQLTPGIYLVRLFNGNSVSCKTFVKD